jgi:hypothetical protein
MDTGKAILSFVRLVGGSFIFVGGLITIAGLIWLTRTGWFTLHASKAPGLVIAMERHDSNDPETGLPLRPTFHPVFTFTDSAGTVHTQCASVGSSSYTFEPGEKVTILYDPSTPENSMIDSFQAMWVAPLWITGFGLLFGGFACSWIFRATRHIRLEQLRRGGPDGAANGSQPIRSETGGTSSKAGSCR